MLVLPDSPSTLFLMVWLLWSLPTAPRLDLWCFVWVWLLGWTGELLCLLLFWGQVQLSTCLLPIEVNGTLETLFCWLRSWWATGTVKCKYLMSSGNQLFYLPQRMFVSETGSSLSNSLEVPLKTAFHLGSENLPSLLDLISGESSDTVVSPLYRRKFGMRFTEIVGSEHRVCVPECLDWRAFAMW